MKNAFYIPGDVFDGFLTGGAMNAQDGACVFAVADPSIAELIPPPLKLTDPDHPLLYIYLVNIREPNFAPWYIEGGIAVMVRYGDLEGSYFFNLQLSGPGALMGALSGRDSVGLPKKLSEEMVVWREGNLGHCYIQRKGVRLLDIKLEIGRYNDPNFSLSIENCQ
ncbi:MAG: acetoacetate decarboxylase family protein, partial [Actinomycetia bacterium]|nr:acetoacetate decarboxylase family protein [Actinomycetes bacterium]